MSGSQYFQILRNVTHKLPLCPAWPALKQTPSHAAASPHVTVSFLHSPSPAFQLCQDKVTPNCTLNSPPCALATCTSCWTEPKNRDSCCIFFFFCGFYKLAMSLSITLYWEKFQDQTKPTMACSIPYLIPNVQQGHNCLINTAWWKWKEGIVRYS